MDIYVPACGITSSMDRSEAKLKYVQYLAVFFVKSI